MAKPSPEELQLSKLNHIRARLGCSVKSAVYVYRFIDEKKHRVTWLTISVVSSLVTGGLMIWLN